LKVFHVYHSGIKKLAIKAETGASIDVLLGCCIITSFFSFSTV